MNARAAVLGAFLLPVLVGVGAFVLLHELPNQRDRLQLPSSAPSPTITTPPPSDAAPTPEPSVAAPRPGPLQVGPPGPQPGQAATGGSAGLDQEDINER